MVRKVGSDFDLERKGIFAKNYNGDTALLLAMKINIFDVRRITDLVKRGSDVNATNNFNETPLKLAVKYNQAQIVELLLNHGAGLNCNWSNPINSDPIQARSGVCNSQHAVRNDTADTLVYLLLNNATFKLQDHIKNSLLHQAVEFQNHELMRLLLKKGASAEARNRGNETPIFTAVRSFKYNQKSDKTIVSIIKELCKFGADVNVTNSKREKPIFLALSYGTVKIFRALIQGGANINSINHQGKSLLHSAIVSNDTEMIKEILQLGADKTLTDRDGSSPLHLAVQYSLDVGIVEELMQSCADVNQCDGNGNTLLHLETSKKLGMSLEFVKKLLIRGVNVNAKNDLDRTPLMLAVQSDNLSVVEELLKHGADENARDFEQNSPLHFSSRCFFPKVDLIEMLIHYGSDVNLRNKNDQTVLSLFISLKQVDIVERILSAEAEVNFKDSSGNTPLHLAVIYPSVKITENLLNGCTSGKYCKSIIDDRDAAGNTALHLATARLEPSVELVSHLLRCGSDVNAKNNCGLTPLLNLFELKFKKHMLATRQEMKQLVDFGADVNASDHDGNTPLLFALMTPKLTPQWIDIVEDLLRYGANPNLENKFSDPPLYYTTKMSVRQYPIKWWLIFKLLHYGADPHYIGIGGNSLCHYAVQDGIRIGKKMKEYHININQRDRRNFTPLMRAVFNGQVKVLRDLLENGADVNCTTGDGDTALHLACFVKRDLDAAKTLLEFGADCNVRNKKGRTPLSLCCLHMNYNIMPHLGDLNRVVRNILFDESLMLDHGCSCYMPLRNGMRYLMLTVGDWQQPNCDLIRQLERSFFEEKLTDAGIYTDCTIRKRTLKLSVDCVLEISEYLCKLDILNCIMAFSQYRL